MGEALSRLPLRPKSHPAPAPGPLVSRGGMRSLALALAACLGDPCCVLTLGQVRETAAERDRAVGPHATQVANGRPGLGPPLRDSSPLSLPPSPQGPPLRLSGVALRPPQTSLAASRARPQWDPGPRPGGRGGRGLELPSHLGPVGLTPQLRSLLEQTGCGQSSWQEASHPGGPATPLQRPPRGSGPSGLGGESGNHPQPLWLPWRLCDLCDLQRGRKEASRALPEPAAEVCLTKTVFKISCGINGQLQHWKDFA